MEISIRRHAPLVGAYTLWALCMLAAATLEGCGGGSVGVDAKQQSVVSSGAVAPQITTQPQSATVTAGQTATFSVAATGTAPLSYQWMKNSTAISGAKSAGYTTPATSSSDNGASFTVAVSNSAGSITTNAATLTVNASGTQSVAPQITAQPQSATVTAGQTATFSVAATGTAPLSYQWMMNSTAISGATSASYTTPTTTTSNTGESFTVKVSNSAGNVTSNAATLTVNASGTQSVAPQITGQPQSATVTAGQTATFFVTATGTAPLSYQWMMSSTAISGATSASYTTPTTTTSNTDESFTVKVSNSAGSATSNAATLTVNSGSGSVDPTLNVLPSYNDLTANWRNAGLQSVGGIPNRTTQCGSTVSPSGKTPPTSGDDAGLINAALTACTAGDFVQLAAGTFKISQSEYIQISTSVSLRGTGNCSGTSTPYCESVIVVVDGMTHSDSGSPVCSGSPTSCSDNPAIIMSSDTHGIGDNNWSGCPNTGAGTGCLGTIATLAADAAQGATTVELNTTTPFSVGMWVMIDEASGAGWQTDPLKNGGQIWAAPDEFSASGSPVTGRAEWEKRNPDPGYGDFSSGNYPYQEGAAGCGVYSFFCDRPTAEIHLITAIGAGPCPGVNCTLTFDDPLTTAFRQSGGTSITGTISGTTLTVSSGTPAVGEAIAGVGIPLNDYVVSGSGATWTISGSATVPTPETMTIGAHNAHVYFPSRNDTGNGAYLPFLEYAGVENLSIQRASGGDVLINMCAYCWVKNVDAAYFAKGAVEVQGAVRVQIDTVFGHECWNDNNNGNEYPIDLAQGSTEIYVVNSMTRACGKSMTARAGGAGSVVAYNYFDDLFYGSDSGLGYTVIDASLNGSHFVGAHGILFEGNWAVNFLDDHQHGNNVYHVYFRNYAAGYRTPTTDPSNGDTINDLTGVPSGSYYFRSIAPSAYDYWHAYVGNVLGTAGYSITSNGWTYLSGTGTENDQMVAVDVGSDDGTSSYDPNMDGVKGSYYFLHGNYDTVTATVHYASSIPSGGTISDTLPNSFYLTSAPSFFGTSGAHCTYGWPWVTPASSPQLQLPTGAGCTADSGLPAKARYDIGTPFVQP